MAASAADIVFENAEARLVIGDNGVVRSLVHKPSGEECLAPGVDAPVCQVIQYRPYDNENFLMFPAKPRTFPSNKCYMTGDTLNVEFTDTYDIAKILVNVTDNYIAFDFVDRDYRIMEYGVKRKTEVDEFTLMQLPLKKRDNFGEWLNVMWDDNVAVALMGTAPTTFIDSRVERDNVTLLAQCHDAVKLYDSGAAIVVSTPDSLLDRIDRLERDFGMPLGVESRRRAEYPMSYYELRDVTVDNIDRNIELALQGGFKTMVVYYIDFAKGCGTYEWNERFPNGMDDLKEITRRITAAGLIPGFHIHYSKVGVVDPYVASGKPDKRFNIVRRFTLTRPMSATDSVIYVEESPLGVRMEDDRRLLHIGDELIMFDGITTDRPYAFTGCHRGVYNSHPADHAAGDEARMPDVDDWPVYIRVDQNTGIQQEIAERLARIYKDCGFRFVYFDGAEDVPMPYWYNVSRSQLAVYNNLEPKPLFAEGAQKSHYGWHILTRGNAFDIFPPERIRTAMKHYTLRCARQVACDFTSVNFGWVNYLAPSEKTMGMQPDMFDFICSKALAWDSPISLVANMPEIEAHPRTADNFEVMKMWERAKLDKKFDTATKQTLRDPEREWTLVPDRKGGCRLQEVTQVTPDSLNATMPVRAFAFDTGNGQTSIIYWDCRGESTVTLPATDARLSLTTFDGKKQSVKRDKQGRALLPASNRRVLTIALPFDEATRLFVSALKD